MGPEILEGRRCFLIWPFENWGKRWTSWKYEHPKQVIDCDTLQGINISHLGKRKIIFKMPFLGDMLIPWRVLAWRSRTLHRLPVLKLQECFELLAETVQVVFGGPELLSLYVRTSMHHMRYRQRKIRENLVFWDIHLKHAEMQIPAGQIQSHLVKCNLEEPWCILEASIIIGMYFLYAPLGVV